MSHRIERLNSEMQKCILDIIRFKVNDPRISEMVSVLSVSVAKDLKTAKVRVSIFGDDAASTFEALQNSAGFIRKEVAERFRDIRSIPSFTFVLDNSMEYSMHINKILDEIKANENKED